MAHFMHYMLPSLVKYSTRPFFKQLTGTPTSPAWTTVTYQTYHNDLERVAAYWVVQLASIGLVPGPISVVGVWLTGRQYSDLVHIYAIVRAGYVPQLFNLDMSLQGRPVIHDLLAATNGKALLYDSSFSVHNISVPCLVIPDIDTIPPLSDPLPDLPDVSGTDMAMIFHTSGTTSGRPKPVPETHRWLRSQAQVQWPGAWQIDFKTQGTFNNLGSFANVGSATTVSYLSWSGFCLIQTSKPDFDANEFLAMVKEGLNAVFLYAPWLSKLLSIARIDSAVLEALRSMGQIAYTGAALNPEDDVWMVENGINGTALYATTETAVCLVADISKKGLPKKMLPAMRPIKGLPSVFLPVQGLNKSDLDKNSEDRAEGGQLFDFFVSEDADNCPHPSIRNRPNGHITGDLFEEIEPGYYAFRGRNDDWIRTGKHLLFCDTKSIEDNVLLTCADIVSNCVVVGHYQPAVVLFVEPVNPVTDNDSLRASILTRTAAFNERLFHHERITNTLQIVVVAAGSLPRTKEKGNIRRKAAEDDHAAVLKTIYAELENM